MTLQASGPISLADIAGEFGGSTPHSLNEYYKGGSLVSNNVTDPGGIPTSGTIDFGDFYGAQKYVLPTYRDIATTGPGTTSPNNFFGANVSYTAGINSSDYSLPGSPTLNAIVNQSNPNRLVQIAISGMPPADIDTLEAQLNGDSFVACYIGKSGGIGTFFQLTPGTLRGGWFRLDGTFYGSALCYNIGHDGPTGWLEGFESTLRFTP